MNLEKSWGVLFNARSYAVGSQIVELHNSC